MQAAEIDSPPNFLSGSRTVGRPLRQTVRLRLLENVIYGHDAANGRAGWKASQLQRILNEPAGTIRNGLMDLIDIGLVTKDERDDYHPTDEGRVYLSRNRRSLSD